MKTLFSTLILTFYIASAFSQEIEIDVSSPLKKITKTIPQNEYIFSLINVDEKFQYHISATSEDIEFDKLTTPEEFNTRSNGKKIIGTFILEKQQQLTISVDILKKNTDSIIDNYTYIYKTKSRGKWQTTFGFNFIYKTKQDTYYSKSDDPTYAITKANNRDKFDFHPTVMFTWHSNKYLDKKNENWKFGVSGGIGYDFDESLSVFLGPSFIYNQNITLTFGGAFHKQKRLTSNYSEGDIINENLTFDQLHTDYIRINPFVSISFRLDKYPFKKD